MGVPRYASDQSSYRSEISGLYDILLVIEMFKEVWGSTEGRVLMGFDGKDALNQALNIHETFNVYQR